METDTPWKRALIMIILVGMGLIGALAISCAVVEPQVLTPTPTRTPRPTATPTATSTPTATPTPAWPVDVYISRGLPPSVGELLQSTLLERADLFVTSPEAAEAAVTVVVEPAARLSDASGDNPKLAAEWVYALVAPFPTLVDDVTWTEVMSSWQGVPSGPFAGQPLLMSTSTAATLAVVLDEPAPGVVEIIPPEELLQRAWEAGFAWAIVPFDQLEPQWKVLSIDGRSVLDRGLDVGTYPLAVRVGASGLERGVSQLIEILPDETTNRGLDRMSVVMMTGVTALARATGIRMDRHGVTYPAEDIYHWLTEPDITHISNEVSFAENCPPPADYTTMTFCSNPAYIGLLEHTDIDVIELTGNHLLDWGLAAMELSLTMYDERGIPYYGGGWDIGQAQAPLTVTTGIHTFGFIGCNPVGPRYDWATEASAGSAPCNYDYLYEQVRQMRDAGVIPIVTLQYWEFYQYEPTPQQRNEFRALAEAGAVIVSGSQAHQPQGFEFHNGAFIHYGLGNLFFDQMWSLETRQEFLDRHVFYDGRHISTEILTAILEDYSRPRPMTAEERQALLSAALSASGW
jgi:poly-gamma-glutamate synthesis protein (capsule biosynthesis protein)